MPDPRPTIVRGGSSHGFAGGNVASGFPPGENFLLRRAKGSEAATTCISGPQGGIRAMREPPAARRAPVPAKTQTGSRRLRLTPGGACDARSGMPSGIPEGAMCVQRLDDSLNSAIHTSYRISLRSSSMPEPRDPLLWVVTFCISRTFRSLLFSEDCRPESGFCLGRFPRRYAPPAGACRVAVRQAGRALPPPSPAVRSRRQRTNTHPG